MADLNLDPVVGEEVRVPYRLGVFRIVQVFQPGEEHPNPNLRTPEARLGTVDLKREDNGFFLPGVPWHRLKYVDETRPVRRTIEWLKTNPEEWLKTYPEGYPDYVVDYEVTAGNDHAGNPAIFARFFVDPEYIYENGRPSEKKVAELNEFLDSVRAILIGLDPDRWTYVRAAEARRALDAAS